MERAIPLGRMAGVRVGMSWVVPLVAFFYAFALAEQILPGAIPGQEGSTYWLGGIAGAALFFLSLLAHEMGHALVGRREGIGVRGITLTLLGGYTQFETEPATPGAELRVSGIGPVTNFVLGAAFHGCALVLDSDADGLLAVLGEVFGWLALINLLLAAFNLIPAAPLDGGAVLAALTWMVTGNRARSAWISAALGLVVGLAFAVLGVALLTSDDARYGTWLLLLGVFLVAGSRSRLRAAPTMARLRGVALGEVMVADPPVVPEWTTLADVVTWAPRWAQHTAFPVQAADGRITGLLTSELVLAVDPARWPHVRAVDVAWPLDRVTTASVSEPVLTALQRSESAASDRILVLWPDGRVAGTAGREAAAHSALSRTAPGTA